MGFAFENFDAIGGWRDAYGKKLPINATGKLPNGDAFSTFPEFRKLLVNRSPQFNRCLTEKLLAYALGRKLEIRDRPATDKILAELEAKKGGLRDLVRLVIASEPFGKN